MPSARRALHAAILPIAFAAACVRNAAPVVLAAPSAPVATTTKPPLSVAASNSVRTDGPTRPSPLAPTGSFSVPAGASLSPALFPIGDAMLLVTNSGAAVVGPHGDASGPTIPLPIALAGVVSFAGAPGMILRLDARGGMLAALDPHSLARLWASRVLPPDDHGRIVDAGRAGDVLVVALTHGNVVSARFVALDTRDGRVLWHAGGTASAGPPTRLVISGGCVISFDPPAGRSRTGLLRGLDLETGHERWRVVPPGNIQAFALAWDDDMVYASTGGGRIAVVDTRAGRTARVLEVRGAEGLRPSAALRDGVLYPAGWWTDREGWLRESLVAMDTATGAERWRTDAAVSSPGESGAASAFFGGTLLYCALGGELRALDPATGAALSRYGLSRCGGLAVVGDGAQAAAFVSGDEGPAIRFAPGDEPARSTLVTGRVTQSDEPWAHARVRVGDQWVRTDAAGAFRTTVFASGSFSVEIVGPHLWADSVRCRAGEPCEATLPAYADEPGD